MYAKTCAIQVAHSTAKVSVTYTAVYTEDNGHPSAKYLCYLCMSRKNWISCSKISQTSAHSQLWANDFLPAVVCLTCFSLLLLVAYPCNFQSWDGWHWKGPLLMQSNTLLQQGQLQHVAQNCVQSGFKYCQRDLHQLSGQPVPVFYSPGRKKTVFLLYLNRFSCFSICAHCLLSWHWAPLRNP